MVSYTKLAIESVPFSLVDRIGKIASSELNVLICGEVGTGIEAVARELHCRSSQSEGPTVRLNCASISNDWEKAFSISEGTIFLNNNNEIPADRRAGLLSRLQETKARVISTSNDDLSQSVATDQFPRNLFCQIGEVNLTLLPLRERVSEIPSLSELILKKLNTRETISISDEAMNALCRYGWPGNDRQLETTLAGAIAIATNAKLGVKDLPARVLENSKKSLNNEFSNELAKIDPYAWAEGLGYTDARLRAKRDFERTYLVRLMQKHTGNVSQAARSAKLDRSNLRKLLTRHAIRPQDFRPKAGLNRRTALAISGQ